MQAALNFPIVGIGASAGGTQALEGFFTGLPEQPGFAIVIVTHLSPERESALPAIVARFTRLPVHVAADDQIVEKDHVYVLPANAILGIKEGRLRLSPLPPGRRDRKPIDIFFSALAEDHGELAVGVILSGGDSDGTLGAKAIKERGGLTLAQVADSFGPHHADMPNSAIASGLVDFAVPAEGMGGKLVEFARGAHVPEDMAVDPGNEDGSGTLEGARMEICEILRSQIGHDFSGYKTKTFIRRVRRRMQVVQVDTIDAYVEHLRQTPQEVGELFRDLLISVTNFFRDADAFECLATLVIPKLFEHKGADDVVRIWVPGCATGEEVYSLGILLREYMEPLQAAPRVQIFATDIDEQALSVARGARYPEPLLEGVSPERRDRFFFQDAGSFVVAKEVRDLCIFSPHSVIRDPPFSRIDMVSCRNLLIYFGADVQRRVIPIFHYALRPDGYLFLGTSEGISQFDELFIPLEKKHRIFQRRSDVATPVRLPSLMTSQEHGKGPGAFQRRAPRGGAALRQVVDNQILERFAPPHVVVNREGDVVYYSTRTGRYLEAAAGAPTRQIFTMARKGLQLELRTIFREAVESGATAMREGVAVEKDDGRVQLTNLIVEPLPARPGEGQLFLILFMDQGPVLSREEALNRAHALHDGATLRMERELRETRERLQSVVEEYETALEELKSSNEELQSTNEELEAPKEELVSLNEELHTVNQELNGKVEELDRAHSDLQNLFDSTSVATVFLDKNLAIRSFTPAMMDVFNIRPADLGRPITDLSSRVRLPNFKEEIARVFAERQILERRIESEDKLEHYLVRLAPYRNSDHKTDGVVVTFLNISNLMRAEARQQVLISELQHRTRNLLTVVQSIARQTLSDDSGFKAFSNRLAALGRLQGIVSKAPGDKVDLADIVRLELEVLSSAVAGKVAISGPSVPLAAEAVQTLALALHELATNALKYGALRNGPGRLDIGWRVERRGASGALLIFEWRESGLQTPPDSSRKGYGRQLIEQALTYTLRAKTELSFGADGIACRIELPLADMDIHPADI